MTINSICVCGAGTMGMGIAQVCAQAGFYTILYELNQEVLARAKVNIEKNLSSLVEKAKITEEEKSRISERISFTSDLQNCLADVFIEAIIEKKEAKIALFNQLAELNHSESIFASNTSSISITSIANQVKNPERVIGMHFFNPAPVMKLVEVVNTEVTSGDITQTIIQLARQMGKLPVACKDSPGFIVNRVARPFYLEALRLVEEGLADFSKIDKLMEASGFKMGPFKLILQVG